MTEMVLLDVPIETSWVNDHRSTFFIIVALVALIALAALFIYRRRRDNKK